jgi:hypothetical protein
LKRKGAPFAGARPETGRSRLKRAKGLRRRSLTIE